MILFTKFYIITSYALKTSMATRQPENAHAGNHPRARATQNIVAREYAFGAVSSAQQNLMGRQPAREFKQIFSVLTNKLI